MNLKIIVKKNKIPILIFSILFLIYFFTVKGYLAVPDSEFSLRTAKSIVERGSLTINAANFEGDYVFHTDDGRIYSKYGIGLALLWVPYVIAGKLIASLTSLPEDLLIRFLISFYNIFFGAGAAVIMFLIIRFFKAPKKIAFTLALIFGLATMCWNYSVSDFSDGTQMFFLLLTVYCVLKNNKKSLIIGGFSFGFLILLRISNLIFIPLFILFILLNNRSIKKSKIKNMAYFLFFVIIIISFLLFLNYIRFGDIFESGYRDDESLKFNLGIIPGNIFSLLFAFDVIEQGKGIFIYNPILLVGILGYFSFFKAHKKESLLFLGILITNLCFYASFYGYHGDWSWGPRYLVIALPFYLLPLFTLPRKNLTLRIFLILFVATSFFIQLTSVLQNDYEYLQITAGGVNATIPQKMPSHIIGSTIILKHKLFKNNNIYNLSEFGINSNEQIDTSEFERFRGLNLWYCHLSRYYKNIYKHI